MKKTIILNILFFLVVLFLISCNEDSNQPNNSKKVFKSSYETEKDFSGFYITPQGHLGTTYHKLSDLTVHTGNYAHKAWIDGANPPSITTNNNHRGYPTIQFQNTDQGVFKTPCYITIWVWLENMQLQEVLSEESDNDWFSFATFTDAETDNWDRTVLVNLNYNGFVHLQHTLDQGEQTSIFQNTNLIFPLKQWVELKIYLDFRKNGYAKVWQNGELVSHANIGNITNKLSQVHFGMYAPPQITNGVIYNDDIEIKEVNEEE